MSDYDERFGGVARLVSDRGMTRLRQARVCVVGIGGVGCWVAEALARSGVGAISLVDLDDLCLTNTNRQLHAINGEFGRMKVEVMGDRIKQIAPDCEVGVVPRFFTVESSAEILRPEYDCVIDSIDSVRNKCHMIVSCKQRGIPIVTTGAAGGRLDPGRVATADLAKTTVDPLLKRVRKLLRREFDCFPESDGLYQVGAVYSDEPMIYPGGAGETCDSVQAGQSLRLGCETGYGSASFVTGTFGFVAASLAIRGILSRDVSSD